MNWAPPVGDARPVTMLPSAGTYVGRFAPSPTGKLHFGSLLAALASYLDARHHRGLWLVRMEDLDPPREQPGAADSILTTLERFGLEWDGKVLYQHQRLSHYQALVEHLLNEHQAYRCDCSRQQIKSRTHRPYDGYCRTRQRLNPPTAVRLKSCSAPYHFADRIQGGQRGELVSGHDDFIILRRDGFYAYQLAVVADDASQGVTDVVRGYDLLDSTPKQLALQQRLNIRPPSYAHIPVVVNDSGQKLSKQTFASALNPDNPTASISQALRILGQPLPPETKKLPLRELLDWAISNWDIERVPSTPNVPESQLTQGA